jgi:hypothetical protein
MSANDIPFPFPSDFEDRARRTHERLAAGEALSNEAIASALGLPIEFFAAAVAIYAALLGRRPVIVDPTATLPRSKLN